MKTFAVLLISLALAHGATEVYESEALNLIGTDAINDVLKYYNYFYQDGHPPAVSDVIADHASGPDHYHVRATDGTVAGGDMKLVSEQAQLQFKQINPLPPYAGPGERYNRIVAVFSITIEDMELNYGNVTVSIKAGDEPVDPSDAQVKRAKSANARANVMIEKNRFSLEFEQRHYSPNGCLVTLVQVTTEEFVIGNVSISGSDPAMEAVVDVLANNFKDQFLTKTYAASVIESIIKARAPHIFHYCPYVPLFL